MEVTRIGGMTPQTSYRGGEGLDAANDVFGEVDLACGCNGYFSLPCWVRAKNGGLNQIAWRSYARKGSEKWRKLIPKCPLGT